jgi:hypothetical protein
MVGDASFYRVWRVWVRVMWWVVTGRVTHRICRMVN